MIDRSKREYAADYALTDEQASTLASIVGLPVDFRRQLLAKHTKGELVEMFAQFIGLANSVVANNREMVELLLIRTAAMPTGRRRMGAQVFMCHEDLDDKGAPTKVCRGFGRARKRLTTKAA